MKSNRCFIHIFLPGHRDPVPCAAVRKFSDIDGVLSAEFAYGEKYLKRKDAQAIHTSLPLAPGWMSISLDGVLPGPVSDSLPDSWGRMVIADRLHTHITDMNEMDFLLNSSSRRIGNLDFMETVEYKSRAGEFPRITFDELYSASSMLEAGHQVSDEMHALLCHGDAIGGTRPKGLMEIDDREWIIKLPSSGDRFDNAIIEYSTMKMASMCGIEVPEVRFFSIAGGRHVFAIDRFDRDVMEDEHGAYLGRKMFVSALGFESKTESEGPRMSYEDLALYARANSSSAERDCEQVFRRMIFNILVSNTGDHARNHGYLRDGNRWKLSPVYDVLPFPHSGKAFSLSINVGDRGRLATVDNAMSRHGSFMLSREDARHIVSGISGVVSGWRQIFEDIGVLQKDISTISSAMMPESAIMDISRKGLRL